MRRRDARHDVRDNMTADIQLAQHQTLTAVFFAIGRDVSTLSERVAGRDRT
jgi:hypothetical protein